MIVWVCTSLFSLLRKLIINLYNYMRKGDQSIIQCKSLFSFIWKMVSGECSASSQPLGRHSMFVPLCIWSLFFIMLVILSVVSVILNHKKPQMLHIKSITVLQVCTNLSFIKYIINYFDILFTCTIKLITIMYITYTYICLFLQKTKLSTNNFVIGSTRPLAVGDILSVQITHTFFTHSRHNLLSRTKTDSNAQT